LEELEPEDGLTMPDDPLTRRIIELLARFTGREASSIRLTDPLDSLDSLDIVELVMFFEDELKIELDEVDANKIKTVGDLVEWIRRQMP